MGVELEEHEVGLAQHRGVDVVDRRGQQLAPRQRVALLAQQAVGHQHLAEHRGGLGERQRGVLGERSSAREASMLCTAWPSSWARVATSRTRPV